MHFNPTIECHLWVQPRHGHEALVGELLDLLVTATLQAEGCLSTSLHRMDDGWQLDGRWASHEALQHFLQAPRLQDLGDALTEHCRRMQAE